MCVRVCVCRRNGATGGLGEGGGGGGGRLGGTAMVVVVVVKAGKRVAREWLDKRKRCISLIIVGTTAVGFAHVCFFAQDGVAICFRVGRYADGDC